MQVGAAYKQQQLVGFVEDAGDAPQKFEVLSLLALLVQKHKY